MAKRPMSRAADERGAMLIQVAISILMLMGFTVFVVDYGIVWVARGQAQNAADAGALAGAVARRYDDSANPPAAGGVAWTSATQGANANLVWGATGVAQPSWTCPPGWPGKCSRVDVYRNGEFGSATLPVFFGPLLGVTSQGVKATATAVVAAGGTVKCMKPWLVADRWPEGEPVTSYVAPYYAGHTGYRVDSDKGLQLVLKEGEPGEMSSGWTGTLSLPNPQGVPEYEKNISLCNPTVVGIATEPETCPAVDEPDGCVGVQTGVQQGQTVHGIEDLLAADSGAYWDTADNRIAGGCTDDNTCPGGVSPRLVPIPLFDPSKFDGSGCTGSTCVAKVVNIVGFFIEGICADVTLDAGNDCGKFPQKAVVGRLADYTALSFGTPVEDTAAFLQLIVLIR
jgi:Flp pilus assembly protein TadG